MSTGNGTRQTTCDSCRVEDAVLTRYVDWYIHAGERFSEVMYICRQCYFQREFNSGEMK
jgi:hypothetical protein